MGEPAKAFWMEEEEEEIVRGEFEDVAQLSTGESDDFWKFGSD